MYKIEKGVPIPQDMVNRTLRKYPFETMEPGDSFLILAAEDTFQRAKVNVQGSMHGWCKRHKDQVFTLRGNLERMEIRVWRVS